LAGQTGAALITEKRRTYSALLASGPTALIPGVKAFLNMLVAAGKRLALATAAKKHDQQAIPRTHWLEKYFIAVIALDEIRFPKPDPKIYLKTDELLKTGPKHCLVFESSRSGSRRTAGNLLVDQLSKE
jgi:beta-phosphoglucomutase-like phosphatase (HAD superfamily)